MPGKYTLLLLGILAAFPSVAAESNLAQVLANTMREGKTNEVQAMLAQKQYVDAASTNLIDGQGFTLLTEAAMNHDLVFVRLLLDAGVSVSAKNARGECALNTAAAVDDVQALKLLGAHGGFKDVLQVNRALMSAINFQRTNAFHFLTSDPTRARATNEFGNTSLMFAANYPNVEMVKFLVTIGVPVNATNLGGQSALHWAVKAGPGCEASVSYLLAHGANPDLKTTEGKTAADVAAERKLLGPLKLLDRKNKHSELLTGYPPNTNSPFIGSWQESGQQRAALELKPDGTGIARVEAELFTVLWRGEKTAAHLYDNAQHLFLERTSGMATNRGEIMSLAIDGAGPKITATYSGITYVMEKRSASAESER